MKLGRNDSCPCKSGKKYKRCCGAAAASVGSRPPAIFARPERVCVFECSAKCAEHCCSGATLVTIDEIRTCYDVFPITIGFRHYRPMNAAHRAILMAIGFEDRGRFIVGDFVAGNWRERRCRALGSNGLCSLHVEGRKPLQCRLVPFSALYPEGNQDDVFREQRRGKFSFCRGMEAGASGGAVWRDGVFTDPGYKEAYEGYRRGLRRQKALMGKVLEHLRGNECYRAFLQGEGILEAPLMVPLLFEVLDAAGFRQEEYGRFVKEQLLLCYNQVPEIGQTSQVLADYRSVLEETAALYAVFLREEFHRHAPPDKEEE